MMVNKATKRAVYSGNVVVCLMSPSCCVVPDGALDPACVLSPAPGPDDSSRHSHSPGGSAEAPPAAGGDCSCLASDTDPPSSQPGPTGPSFHCSRVPSTAAASQGPGSRRGHERKEPGQAQRGQQLVAHRNS